MKFAKVIEQTDTGMVIASVYNTTTDRRIGLEFFCWPPFSQKKRLQRAHKWADLWIGNCQTFCVDRTTLVVGESA